MRVIVHSGSILGSRHLLQLRHPSSTEATLLDCRVPYMIWGFSKYFFGGPCNKGGDEILGSILESPYFGKRHIIGS